MLVYENKDLYESNFNQNDVSLVTSLFIWLALC
jgi:hypothetical protein